MTAKRAVQRAGDLIRTALPTLLVAAAAPRRRSTAASRQPRILIVRLDQIGDFIMMTPFLRELRRAYPHSPITLVVRRNISPLAQACPYTDRVLVLESFPARERFSSYLDYLKGFAGYLGYLRDFAARELCGRFDLAIQPRWDTDWDWATLLARLSGAPRVVGYSERASADKRWTNFGQNRLLTDVLNPGPDRHEAERGVEMVRFLTGHAIVSPTVPEAWWTSEDDGRAAGFFKDRGISGPVIAFGIGAAGARRQWPFYADLIEMLLKRHSFTPLLVTGPGEEDLADAITARVRRAVVLCDMPLGAVAAILARCALFAGDDSGPMHLAAAVGLPVVEISCHPEGAPAGHPNSPDRTGPLASVRAILRPVQAAAKCAEGCVEDTPHCIAGISPETVADAVLALAQESGALTAKGDLLCTSL